MLHRIESASDLSPLFDIRCRQPDITYNAPVNQVVKVAVFSQENRALSFCCAIGTRFAKHRNHVLSHSGGESGWCRDETPPDVLGIQIIDSKTTLTKEWCSMKTTRLMTVVFTLALVARSVSALAGDPYGNLPGSRSGMNRMPVQRSMLGLPIPQQWSGARPVGYNGGNSGYNRSMNCPNGQCGTMGNCANGQCATGNCANGQCATGNCPNGQCSTGNCPNGQCGYNAYNGAMNCPNGQCGVNQLTRRPVLPQSGWTPRTNRGNAYADPFRRTGSLADEDAWTSRPVVAPIRNAFGSRYDERDLNLNSEYFGDRDADSYDLRTNDRARSIGGRNSNYRSNRSMEVPQEHSTGSARI